MLELNNISKTYVQGSKEIKVLNDVNLNLESGKTLSIMGKSGSGKSSLLSLVSGILKPDKGKILINGINIIDLNEDQLSNFRASEIGFVFQNFHLVSYLNALENVALPARLCGLDQAEEKARKLLTQVGLTDRLDHLPAELSGGEKQRVAIARALIHNPSLVLADEPSGSLDDVTGEQIMDLLFGLVKEHKRTLVLVTHSKEHGERCDYHMQIESGRLEL